MNILSTRKLFWFLFFSQALILPAQAAVFNINCNEVIELINAINTANGNGEADEINLNSDNQANCVYQLTVAIDHPEDGVNGLPSITTPIIINGHQSTIRRQDNSPEFRIIHVAADSNLTLKQLRIENGLTSGDGGGISNGGKLTLEDSTIAGNTARYGGGISNRFTITPINSNKSTATLINSTVMGNTAEDIGGGIANFVNSTIMLTNSTVVGNTAGYGGGIYNWQFVTVMLTNSTILKNIATVSGGGGILNLHQSFTYLTNSTVAENTANSRGGGILNSESTITLTNSVVIGNVTNASGSGILALGGGIHNDRGTATFINSTITGNISGYRGGGISNTGGSTALINSTVVGNTADYGGGGISNIGSADINSTILGNPALSGNPSDYIDGVYKYSGIYMFNTILAGNRATTSNPDCLSEGALKTNYHNLFGGDGTECQAGETDFNLTALGKIITDVLNPTLANNGGPTQTLALVDNSPAIDAGNDEICKVERINSLDQRGIPRTGISAGSHCDIGAVEFQASGLVELIKFAVTLTDEKNILFKWKTGAERHTAGFYLWQAEPFEGNCEQFTHEIRLTDKAIPSQGNENGGAYYEYRYESPVNASNSCYGLEERETSGKRNFYIIGPGIDKRVGCISEASYTFGVVDFFWEGGWRLAPYPPYELRANYS